MIDAVPATGILSGHVYVDANGNGVQDAGEPGLDDVPVLLEGTATAGSVQRSTVSQGGGLYRFADLPQGTYTLSVGEVIGHGNGTHQAGVAGGVVEVGRISQIVLDTGVEAGGYLFAKVPTASAPTADLQVMSLEGQTPVSAGEATGITVQVRNVGPHAALAQTNLSLPEGFSVTQVSASSGSFDTGTGLWSHGSLLPGQQHSLMLQGT